MAKIPEWKIHYTNQLYDIYTEQTKNENSSDRQRELEHLGLCILAVDGSFIRNTIASILGSILMSELYSDTNELFDEGEKFFITEKIAAEELYNNFDEYQSAVAGYSRDFLLLVMDTILRYKKEKNMNLIFFLLDRKNGIGPIAKDYVCRKKYPSLYKEPWVLDSEESTKQYVSGRMVKAENMLRIINKYTDEITWFTMGQMFINPNRQKEKARCIFEKLFPIQYQNFECTHSVKDLQIILDVLTKYHCRTNPERVRRIVYAIWPDKLKSEPIQDKAPDEYEWITRVFEKYVEGLKNPDEIFIMQHYSEAADIFLGKEKYSYEKVFFYWKNYDSNQNTMTAKAIADYLGKNWDEKGVKLQFRRLLQQFNYRSSNIRC